MIKAFIPKQEAISVSIPNTPTVVAEVSPTISTSILPVYDGDYVITPGRTSVVLETKNKKVTDNIVINPIPQNYGLITWNGSVLTVS